MRGAVDDLVAAHPIGESLPACYVTDPFVQAFTAALDDVLGPVFVTLDCLSGYLDPWLAPADYLDWLAGWVALAPDETGDPDRQRTLIARAVGLHRRRGTRAGLAEQVVLLTGGAVEVLDAGGCTWSEQSGGPLPGSSSGAGVVVRVRVGDPAAVDQQRLRAVVTDAVPAHLPVVVDVRGA